MLAVGLTGDVGAGKSTLSSIWAAAGAHVVDADAVVAELWKTEEVISLATGRWGRVILSGDGMPDHAAVSRIVFDDETEYRWLCDAIHPMVREIMAERVRRLDGWVVAEIPLLFENGVPEWIDLTVYVEAAMELRFSRNRSRGWGPEEMIRRERWLLERSKKQGMADLVMTNDGSLERLEREARDLARRFLAASSIMLISVGELSADEAGLICGILSGSGLAAEVRIPDSGFFVSAFVRRGSLEEVSALLEKVHPGGGLPVAVQKCAFVPKHVLLWAMEGTGS
ncbi:MAG: dephospho-CoA kinase [Thermovirgaceae bacterium]|nr:dephospho-CoA kinase [Thermovirgaceae bacterium]